MLDKRLAVTGAAIIVVIAAAYLAIRPPQTPQIAQIGESVSGISREAVDAAPDTPLREDGYMYVIKEYEGRVAVFPAGKSEPEVVLDVFVQYLPDLDREQMAEGIPVKDYNELVALLEDYTS